MKNWDTISDKDLFSEVLAHIEDGLAITFTRKNIAPYDHFLILTDYRPSMVVSFKWHDLVRVYFDGCEPMLLEECPNSFFRSILKALPDDNDNSAKKGILTTTLNECSKTLQEVSRKIVETSTELLKILVNDAVKDQSIQISKIEGDDEEETKYTLTKEEKEKTAVTKGVLTYYVEAIYLSANNEILIGYDDDTTVYLDEIPTEELLDLTMALCN